MLYVLLPSSSLVVDENDLWLVPQGLEMFSIVAMVGVAALCCIVAEASGASQAPLDVSSVLQDGTPGRARAAHPYGHADPVYTGAAALVVEGALPFTVFSLAYLVAYALGSDVANAFSFYAMFTVSAGWFCVPAECDALRQCADSDWPG